jgi:hypothetical protein
MPTPARKRKSARLQIPAANADNRVNTEKQVMLNIMVRTRPKRSATGPQIIAVPQPIMNKAKRRPP